MILYFADRKMNIIGQASTSLPNCIVITNDYKIEDIETGITSFEADIQYGVNDRQVVQKCTQVGNYILRSDGKENEFYTIIDSEEDTKEKSVNIYAEDAGLDLINEMIGPYKADKAYPISHYIKMFAYDSGFEIGINEASSLTRKLSWEGEATVTERLASVATQFDHCEISYSFEVKNLTITNKLINVRKKRGKDEGATLKLNYELDRIISKKTIANLATALNCSGGIPENSETPINLKGYQYDDGDFYISGNLLCSRKAKNIWSRYVWNKEPNKINGECGHIVRMYSYDTLSQQTLCNHAITKLKKLREIEINYEVDISRLPANVGIGDKVNIVDEEGQLYLSTRILQLEKSVCNKTYKAILGDFLIKKNDINKKVLDLAEKFAKESLTSKRALNVAINASNTAIEAKQQADNALTESNNALQQANSASEVAAQATTSATEAQTKAAQASQAVGSVQIQVQSIETTVNNANLAAQNAHKAAETAQKDALTAKQKATDALKNADSAKLNADEAKLNSVDAISKSEGAVATAQQAKLEASTASETANAAKLDADQAKKDVVTFTESLNTLEHTMIADYARKTDLTETESKLQTSISQNAAGIATNAKQITAIDETANTAKKTADTASQTASAAQAKANDASLAATDAQTKADQAKADALAAQTNADTAKLAAQNAETVAGKAQTDLLNAQKDLETVTSRVGATEQEIADAQAKVLVAQQAADKAKTDALEASKAASDAQLTANTASTNATKAQKSAEDAAVKALNAQNLANQAKGDASDAQLKAEEAAGVASAAQTTADLAKTNAAKAQAKADQAAIDVTNAQQVADSAQAKADQASLDLVQAQKNLEDVTGRVGATELEVANAQAAVIVAQEAANKAKTDALNAQNTADLAKGNAAKAQTDATNAKKAADSAQAEATLAKKAANQAQADANSLAVRVTVAETKVAQNSDAIKLAATKTEVAQTLGNYYTKEETNSHINIKADSITQTVSKQIDSVKVGARNLIVLSRCVDGVVVDGQVYPCHPDSAYYITQLVPCVEGSEYTLSSNQNGILSLGWFDANNKCINRPTGYLTVDKGYKSTFVVPAGAVNVAVSFKKEMRYSVKLEHGNKATDWTPAPEDVDQKISDDINTNIENATSTITEAYTSAIEAKSDSINLSVEQTTNDINDKLGKLSSTVHQNRVDITNEYTEFVNSQTTTINDAIKENTNGLSELKQYVRIQNGTIALGASDNKIQCLITPSKMGFYQGEPIDKNEIAHFSGRELFVNKAIIATSIGCGEFQFVHERTVNELGEIIADNGFSLL